jgi:hypothetical protein
MFCPLLPHPYLEKLAKKETVVPSVFLKTEDDNIFTILDKWYHGSCISVDNLGEESILSPIPKYEACDLCYCQNVYSIVGCKNQQTITVPLLSVKDYDVKETIDEFFSQVANVERVRTEIPYQLDYICSDDVHGIMCTSDNSEWFFKNPYFNKEILINEKMGENVILFKNGSCGAAIPFKIIRENGIDKVIKFGLVLFADYIDVMPVYT